MKDAISFEAPDTWEVITGDQINEEPMPGRH
jgi:hypothetical protein